MIYWQAFFSREGREYLFEKKDWRCHLNWAVLIWCRLRGHPDGEVFYNAGGTEPDHHCRNCGDLIG